MASSVTKKVFIIYITCLLFLFPVVFSGKSIEGRRLMGSAPPNCTGKCQGCVPCKRVLVDVPPTQVASPEWFHLVWRCSCGGKIFMPNGTPV
ncbi:hypothetical protein F511_25104 [Dorcoceras hygrometricum]|uniref:Epidermal patterning factor-like protein n=1 Tax=Dorcoceras hygrometricum TaxID=472368 RepID=A0A2Z7AJU6_9LAMI|nr:hypothetical protein F511_25104 [Dorcoceras hygrometricum]